jgi:hypothetical protein
MSKYAYNLSTRHSFADEAFTRLIKRHEKNNIVCSKYFYNIWITLNLSTGAENTDFDFVEMHSEFLNSGFKTMGYENMGYKKSILEHINKLTECEKTTISKNYSSLIGTTSDAYDSFLLLNLIRLYEQKYRYLFVTFTLDYSQDIGLVHQCALLIDLKEGIFIFYEPYGTYIKYEQNYAAPIHKYLNIYAAALPKKYLEFGTDVKSEATGKSEATVKFTTFHKHFIPDFSEGIQNIILQKNNSLSDIFADELKQLLSDTEKICSELYSGITRDISIDKNPVKKTDKTVDILTVLDNFEMYKYNPLLRDLSTRAFKLYYLYNSKTCVSITLIEMDALFKGENLNDLYKIYKNASIPNVVLMKKITLLIEELFNIT